MNQQQKSGGAFRFSLIFWPLFIPTAAVAWLLSYAIFRPHAHYISAANGCINNLRQIDAAVQQFALENHLTNGSPVHFPTDLTPYIKLNGAGKIPPCPRGGIYHIDKVGEAPLCSLGWTVTPAHILQ